MDEKPRTLREVAQRASDRHDGKRGRELGRRAEGMGLTLSYTTVDKILAGTYNSTPSDPTLDALAKLSGVPREDVFALAGVPLPLAPLADQLPPGSDTLLPEQRNAVLGTIRQFASLNRALAQSRSKEVVGNAEHPAPRTQAGDVPAFRDSKANGFADASSDEVVEAPTQSLEDDEPE